MALNLYGRREDGKNFCHYWFGKNWCELDAEEHKSYKRAYNRFKKTGVISAPEEVAYVNRTKIKKFTVGQSTRQRIRCACGRQIITMYNGILLDIHKLNRIHDICLAGKPDIATIALIDKQWNFDDAELMDNITVKKMPTTDYALPEKTGGCI